MDVMSAMDDEERIEGNEAPREEHRSEGRFVRNHADKGSRARFSLGRAFSCAWEGIAYTTRTQRNMKIHFAVGAAAVILGFALALHPPSCAATPICLPGVPAADCSNTPPAHLVHPLSPVPL